MNNFLPTLKSSKGFSLIEILTVMAILSLIGVVASSMFFTILKGSTKTQITTEIKQNGNYALSVMERMIRNAESLDAYTADSLTITSSDGFSTTFFCHDGDGDGFKEIASNSAKLISNKVQVNNCSIFQVDPGIPKASPDTVTINFDLSQVETTEPLVHFETTVSLRNY